MTAGTGRTPTSPAPGRALADLAATVITELAPLLDTAALAWQDSALCAETDPEIFFPEKGSSVRQPKRVCAACEVRPQCLEYALEHGIRFGIWGGMTERERRPLARQAA